MLGRAVSEFCTSKGDIVLPYDHQSLDIADSDWVMNIVSQDKPDAVINCAAWTDVDGCERDRERAFAANARGPENLAKATSEINAGLVTISTDYVFKGDKDGFYAASKLEGERRAQSAAARTIVVRTGFVFGPGGTNFLSTIIERAKRGERLKAIRDAFGTPSYTSDLAQRLRELTLLDLPGIFHVVNAGQGVSYEEFARAALGLAGYASTNVESVAMDSLNRPAPRPRNSRLKCLLSEAVGLPPLPFWKDSLSSFAALDSQREVVAKN
jgi:dTDP-4-dehydrorhamnose reductase